MRELSSETPGPGVLERARIHAALNVHELWLRYFGIGGSAAPADVASFLVGTSEPDRREYNLLVDSLNERFTELRLNRPVLYAV